MEKGAGKMLPLRLKWLLLILLYGVWAVWWWNYLPAPRERLPDWTPAEKARVIERMKYHGIDMCIQDEQGYYFVRDGKRCRL